ncbi:Uncharacterised protein [Mycobacteroides abscessus subsp. massiliense]|nr:Uncharacterised protein [Mycobacteroides abscessus subsp. massiliense]
MQCGRIGEAGQVLGTELLIHGDPEQVQLGGAQWHPDGHHGERGQEEQR